jgi:hypothetical protein
MSDRGGKIKRKLEDAVTAMLTQCDVEEGDPASPASVKIRAAEAILDHAAKAIEIQDIEARVAGLEAAAPGNSRSES